MAMKNHNQIQLALIIAAIFLIVNVACAAQPGNKSSSVGSVTNITLNNIEEILSGDLKEIASFGDINKAIKQINSGVKADVDALLGAINEILLTSYRAETKEYRRGCNFLQISTYLSSLKKDFEDLEKCSDGCNESELGRIKHHLEHNYSDMKTKAISCRTYLMDLNQDK